MSTLSNLRIALTPALALALLSIPGCGGGGGGSASPAIPAPTFTVGGSIAGLNGTVVLKDNGADSVSVSSNGGFSFGLSLQSGLGYAVTVSTQPTGQTCAISSGSGTIAGNVSNVTVTCTTNTYPVGGTVTGLSTGPVVLANGSDVLTVAAGGGSFAFATRVSYGSTYGVSVQTQPAGQICTVASGVGTIAGNVSNISVSCTINTYPVGGTVTGLSTGPLVLANGNDALTVAAGSGSFTFAVPVGYGSTYGVSVRTQPVGQTCTVASGAGTIAGNVSGVAVSCTLNTYPVGGTVSGLSTGPLALANGNEVLTVTAGSSSFAFATPVTYGSTYTVSVRTQPVGETCQIQGPTGTATAAVSLAVSCTLNRYAIQGTVSGLTSGQVVLVNGSDALPVTAGATTFTFPTTVTYGLSYSVSVQALPPQGSCHVTGASGTVTGPVTTLHVSCGYGLWAWMSGSALPGAAATYGTLGQPAAANTPGARNSGASWTDNSGVLWLYGGASTFALFEAYGDLWQFNPATQLWTWISGSSIPNSAPVLPLIGTASATATPGGRSHPQHWSDSNANFWLFSGGSCTGRPNDCGNSGNDLWKYSISSGQWTWVGGANVTTVPVQSVGNYGSMGIPAASNIPSGRGSAATWTDPLGNLWMFGGYGFDANSSDQPGFLNDLWEYSTSTGLWTWIGGSTATNTRATYGTRGVAAPSNNPGARQDATAWTDAAGNLWLFGGYGYDPAGGPGGVFFSDLWEYSPASGLWTWVGGTSTPNTAVSYGIRGFPSASNLPPARHYAAGWADRSGKFWLFGGQPASSAIVGELSDLWSYDPPSGLWTWVGGPNNGNTSGIYGTLGQAALGNVPGSRDSAITWIDPAGNLWLLGGENIPVPGTTDVDYNDLWRYTPAP